MLKGKRKLKKKIIASKMAGAGLTKKAAKKYAKGIIKSRKGY